MRAAGLVSIAVPRAGDFRAQVRSPGAYWLAGTPNVIPTLYWTSSARVVRDVRRAFGVSAGSIYDQELGDALSSRWASMRPNGVEVEAWSDARESWLSGWRAAEVIPLAAFRALVWWTFLRDRFPGGPVACLFAREVGLPRLGEEIGTLEANIAVGSGEVDANAWPFNPFSGETRVGGEPVYNPWCNAENRCDPYALRGRSSGKVSGGGALALGVVALLVVAGSSRR